jgi:DNA-binding response OmpR family regulator
MISGHPRELDEASLRGLRAEFMAKPFAPEALLVRVGAILADAAASSST